MSSLQTRAEAAQAFAEQVAAEPVSSPPRLTHPEIRSVFYGLMLGGFLSAVNQTIVASALPTIGRELNDFQNLSWVIIAYLLSSTIVAPLYGKLADIHGRRGMMLVADRALRRGLGDVRRSRKIWRCCSPAAPCKASAAAASCR